jgi:membrane-bound lytic murein transglycosylase MltF
MAASYACARPILDSFILEMTSVSRSCRSIHALRWVWIFASFVLAPLVSAQEPESAGPPVAESDDPILDQALTPWMGDLDGILKRGMLRVAVPYGLMTYFNDGPEQRGLTYDNVMALEQWAKKKLGKEAGNLTLVILPTNRAGLLPMLLEGRSDLAAGTITVTEGRRALVDFSDPFHTQVREVLVTGRAAPEVKTAEDMLASKVYLRPSTSFYGHLAALNAKRVAAGKAPFPVEPADENLTDDDLIEMVGTGIIPATIADEPVAKLFAQVFENVRVRDDLVLASDQHIAWAMRKDSPKLKGLVNGYVAEAGKGTKLGNMLLAKYLKSATWAKNALGAEDRQRFKAMADLLKTYAGKYDFDWLMIAAQGYQESQLDQSKRSAVGAIGVMQLMPTTAQDPNVGIPDIHKAEPNIHAGVKYLRFLRDRYYSDPALSALDQTLFSFAAYNAGPGNIAKARKRAEKLGLDPNVWLDNVEIATAKVVSREPVVYVRNIYKYYVAYKLLTEGKAGAAAEQ